MLLSTLTIIVSQTQGVEFYCVASHFVKITRLLSFVKNKIALVFVFIVCYVITQEMNMKLVYKNKGNTLGGYRCVTMQGEDNEHDSCLSGERGEIWESAPGRYKALVSLPSGSEKIITFNHEDLHRWLTNLKVPVGIDRQAVWANNPELRHTKKRS